jgi:hypothetical protein
LSSRYHFSDTKNSIFLVSVVADRHPKSIFLKKLNPDPSPPGPDPGVEEGGRRQPRREGGAIDRHCRLRSRHLGGPPESIRAHAALEEPTPTPPWRSPRPRHRHCCFGGGPTPPLSVTPGSHRLGGGPWRSPRCCHCCFGGGPMSSLSITLGLRRHSYVVPGSCYRSLRRLSK